VNTTGIIIVAAVIVVAVIALGLIFLLWRRRSQKLREEFGPEYKHAVRQYGDTRKAETELAARQNASANSIFARSRMKSKTVLHSFGKPHKRAS
jgi:hypothetical protein